MKKILYLITSSDWGGAQKYVLDLASHMDTDNQVTVAVGSGNGQLIDRLNDAGIRNMRIKHLDNSLNPLKNILAYFQIKNVIKSVNPDLVHLNSTKAGFLGSLAARKLGIQSIFTAHGFISKQPEGYLTHSLHLIFDRSICRNCDKVICVSQNDLKQANKLLPKSPAKCIYIPNGVAKMTINKHRSDKNITIGTVSNLVKNKNLPTLLRASMHLPNYNFLIAGEGQRRKDLERIIGSNNIRNVKLLGYIEDIPGFLSKIDIFVLTSTKEGLPYSLLEAAAAGIPIVATAVGGNSELVIDGLNGKITSEISDSVIAAAITEVGNNLKEYKGRAQEYARRILGDFSLDRMQTTTEKVYQDMLKIN